MSPITSRTNHTAECALLCISLFVASCTASRDPLNRACPGATEETCNEIDDDCDGMIDESYDLASNPRNCGACGHVCDLPNAIAGCVEASCTVDLCVAGYDDSDSISENGCERECSEETCNEIDDDCDGTVDEDVGGEDCVPRVVQVTAGAQHTCALRETGTVHCWGQNTLGQLGNGKLGDQTSATQVDDLDDAVQIGAGRFHTCARKRDGRVACWGDNAWKQLSNEPQVARNTPFVIAGVGTAAVSLGAGYFHTCVVNDVGGVSCWGWNGQSQLGRQASSEADVQEDVLPVRSLQNVAEVSGGFAFTCARHTNGTVSCWGDNSRGQLGDGTTTGHSSPALVQAEEDVPIEDVIAISAGAEHACALQEGDEEGEGTVLCWGINDFGGVGNGDMMSPVLRPISTRITDATEVAAGYLLSCARRNNGDVMCWGFNDSGQLGDGSVESRPRPSHVLDLNARSLFVDGGDFHSCAVRDDAAVVCWGSNATGQLGNGEMSEDPELAPVLVNGL